MRSQFLVGLWGILVSNLVTLDATIIDTQSNQVIPVLYKLMSGNLSEVDTIDTQEDIKEYPGWTVGCIGGYQEDWRDFDCDTTGGIDFPAEHQNDSVGYWTQCETSICRLTYDMAHNEGYMHMTVSVYQRNRFIQICRDNMCESYASQGWHALAIPLSNVQKVSSVWIRCGKRLSKLQQIYLMVMYREELLT